MRVAMLSLWLWTAMTSLVADESAERVRAWLVAAFPQGSAQGVEVVVAGKRYAGATLIAATETSVQLHAPELDGDLPWALLGDEGVCVVAENLVVAAPLPVREAWLLLALRCGLSRSPGFGRVRDGVVLADPAAAARVAAAMDAAKAKPTTRAKAEAEGAPERASPTGDAPADAAPEAAPEADEVGPMVDKGGKIIRSAYVRWAFDYGAPTQSRRLGPTPEQLKAKPEKRTIPCPPTQVFKPGRNGQGMPWTVGGPPVADPGNYCSTHGQVLYAPDAPNDPGIDRISILDSAHNVFSYAPSPTWWGGSHPEPMLATPAWREAFPKGFGSAVGAARGYGMWCNSAIIPFTSGLVATAGTCTSQNPGTFLQLPPEKVPTAIALTPRNEFALITVWDVAKLKGEIAVVALECHYTDGLMALYSWHQVNPCLPNCGGFTSMKLLGYVELPFATPTAIVASGNRWNGGFLQIDGKNAEPPAADLAKPEIRETFAQPNGKNARYVATAGFAVVASRFENQVAFVDLQPLYQHVVDMYFTSAEKFQRTRDYGPGPRQWPCDFTVDAKPKPVVVKAVRVKAPSAVAVTPSGDAGTRAYVASEDGALHVWRVGGLATEAPAAGDEVAECGRIAVGRNPTCIAYAKNVGWGKPDTLTSELIVVSRGDREIDWVRLDGDGGAVFRRLRDSRLVDPVHAEVADLNGTEAPVLSVTDFLGKQVVNYRFGPVIFHSHNGLRVDMGPDGKDEFECGGVMAFPGRPYVVTGTNVN